MKGQSLCRVFPSCFKCIVFSASCPKGIALPFVGGTIVTAGLLQLELWKWKYISLVAARRKDLNPWVGEKHKYLYMKESVNYEMKDIISTFNLLFFFFFSPKLERWEDENWVSHDKSSICLTILNNHSRGGRRFCQALTFTYKQLQFSKHWPIQKNIIAVQFHIQNLWFYFFLQKH